MNQPSQKEIKRFQKIIWSFYHANKRNFPWRNTHNPYRILVSEVMLQQTQADRVVPFYKRFLKRFPTLEALAQAQFRDIYPLWEGLGYNRRAMYLKRTAEAITEQYRGKFPKNPQELQQLPGIGKYTARAVCIFSFDRPLACVETNIRRVFIHHFLNNADSVEEQDIEQLADLLCDTTNPREWNYALMDYGAWLKTQVENPNRKHKNYTKQSSFNGSLRQIRGNVLKLLAEKPRSAQELVKIINREASTVEKVLTGMKNEGLISGKRILRLA